jgi:hypothetical protein
MRRVAFGVSATIDRGAGGLAEEPEHHDDVRAKRYGVAIRIIKIMQCDESMALKLFIEP